jgi:hypothetical protein
MADSNNIWFTYEPIPHTDKGFIYCEGPVSFTAKVTRWDFGKRFSIEYEGLKNEQIDSILKQMNEWFYHTHIKDAEDNEF